MPGKGRQDPKLKAIPLSVLVKETGLSRRALIKARNGQVRPHARNQLLIENAVKKFFAEAQSTEMRGEICC
jgi:hypothetical protein